jgi:transcriptional regulator with XRE-family HTH domain
MDDLPANIDTPALSLASKISRLVAERGWNQEEFARMAGLNRQTARQIMKEEGERTLRNSTISACAKALGLSVNDLRMLPLERLLGKMTSQPAPGATPASTLRERATQPELIAWIDRNPERAAELTPDEVEELLSLQDETGGVFARYGVEQFAETIERRRRIVDKVITISNTEKVDLLEQLVDLIFDKIQPYPDRT